MIQCMLVIWYVVPLPFQNPVSTSGISWFMSCWSLAWRIMSIALLAWNEWNCKVVSTFFDIALLWDWNESWLFPVLWPLLRFPKLWHIECSTLKASSLRILNSSAGISLLLPFSVVMLPKAHLTWHSRMSDHTIRWVTTLIGGWPHYYGYPGY